MGLRRPNQPESAIAPLEAQGRVSTPVVVAPSHQPTAADLVYDQILSRVEPALAVRMSRTELMVRVEQLVAEIADQRRLLLNQQEQEALAAEMVDDMIGLGPLEPLLHDETLSDILVNGPRQVYVERRGKLELTDVRFRNNAHVLHVAQRIASAIGRRVDEASPMLDARLADGSRVNVIILPLSAWLGDRFGKKN